MIIKKDKVKYDDGGMRGEKRSMPRVSESYSNGFEKDDKCVHKDYGKCQMPLECIIEDIASCVKELQAIDYLQYNSIGYGDMRIDYFVDNKKIDISSRRKALLDFIIMGTKELEERIIK